MRPGWMDGTVGSVIAISVGALFLAAGIYGFAEHSASKVSQTIASPDWLCTGLICLGLLVIAVTTAKGPRGRHAGRWRHLGHPPDAGIPE